MKTWLKKMEPKFFGFSTPKLTKLAQKINFGTTISRDFIVASTKLCAVDRYTAQLMRATCIEIRKLIFV